MLAVAIKEAFRTALTGRCDARPELAASRIPLALNVPALRCRGGATLARRVFAPLGWHVDTRSRSLTPPEWGDSPYLGLRLTGELRLADALNHLYVLLPVLDDAKHYWVSTDEVDKLIRAGGGWLAGHPEKELITRRYLGHQKRLTRAPRWPGWPKPTTPSQPNSTTRSPRRPRKKTEPSRSPSSAARPSWPCCSEAAPAASATSAAARASSPGTCCARPGIDHVVATDVSARALQLAARRLNLERMPDRQRERLTIFQSSLTYRDDRLAGLDAAVLMEVIEHLDPDRIPALERVVFGGAAPGTVVVTTPNAEYNAHFETLPPGAARHPDHRFEWTRAQFRAWAAGSPAATGTGPGSCPSAPRTRTTARPPSWPSSRKR